MKKSDLPIYNFRKPKIQLSKNQKWKMLIIFITACLVILTYWALYAKEIGGSNYRFHTLKYEKTLAIWQNKPVTEHRFLSFTHESENAYLSRPILSSVAYVSFQSFFKKSFSLAAHWSTYLLFISLSSISVLILTLVYFNDRAPISLLLGFFLSFGLVVFSSNAFHYYYYFDHDNFYSLLGLSYGTIAFLHVEKVPNKKYLYVPFLIPLVVFGHFGALVFFIFFIVFEKPQINRKWYLLAFITLLTSILLPYFLGDSSLPGSGSGIRARSGLDGITDRMQNHFQALVFPDWQGGSTPLMRWIPITSTIILIPLFSLYLNVEDIKANLVVFLKIFLIGSIGYFPDLIAFPQSVSVHPYLYDFGWINPLNIATAAFIMKSASHIDLTKRDLRLFYIILAAAFIAMLNLIHVAQLG